MKDVINSPPEAGVDPRIAAGLVVDLAMAGASEEQAHETAGNLYRSSVPRTDCTASLPAHVRHHKMVLGRLGRNTAAAQAIEPLITVASAETVCRPSGLKRLAGWALLLIAVVMLVPVPFIVASAIYQSGQLALVEDYPMIALVYGIGPLGAAIAVHGMKEAIRSARLRRAFDLLLNVSAVLAAGYWASLVGDTFLADPASGFGAAAESAATLTEWYGAQLLVELTAGAAALNAASELLMTGAKPVSVPNPAKAAAEALVEADHAEDRALAEEIDALTATEGVYDRACAAFQERCVLQVAAARALIDRETAASNQTALASARATILKTMTGGDTPHA
ncbi:MAG: hypothetical protein AAFR84_06120 [Pseudomonadota bacterium]